MAGLSLMPDLHEAKEHLDHLGRGCDERFTFQILPESETTEHPQILHGSLSDVAPALIRANRAGAGVFVTLNETDGLGRSAAHIVAIRALVIDCDRPRLRRLAIPSSFSVQTSPGRGHHYWRLVPGVPLESFGELQRRLARYYGGDPAVCDLGRVLRLAGFYNRKRAAPFLVRLLRSANDRTYGLDEILSAHPQPRYTQVRPPAVPSARSEESFVTWSRRAPIQEGARNSTAFRIAVTGYRHGIRPAFVEAEVHAYCVRAGIPAEAAAVLRSALRAASSSSTRNRA